MCSNLREFKYTSKYDNNFKVILIKCGYCLECQRDKSLVWAQRLMREAKKHKDVCFLTLTYRDAPYDLNIRDFQLFMKRLRKKIFPTKVLYFTSGEYGELNGRPHFHVILFGWKPFDLIPFGNTKRGEKIYVSKFLEDTWGHGYVSIGEVSFKSVFYCAKYMQKCAWSDTDKKPPFVTMSTSVTLGFDRDSFYNLMKPTYFVNGFERPIPNSLIKRAEKEGFDISGLKKMRESWIEKNFQELRRRNIENGKLLNFEADKEKQIKKDLEKVKKKY